MRVVLQRVTRAEVRVGDRVTGRIGRGFLLLAGFHPTDTDEHLTWLAEKIIGLRLFPAESGDSGFDRTLGDVEGDVLVVSQFTLYGDTRRGRRPGFSEAAPPAIAEPLYERFVQLLRERHTGSVETGEFGAMMEVSLVNDGPVTLLLER